MNASSCDWDVMHVRLVASGLQGRQNLIFRLDDFVQSTEKKKEDGDVQRRAVS